MDLSSHSHRHYHVLAVEGAYSSLHAAARKETMHIGIVCMHMHATSELSFTVYSEYRILQWVSAYAFEYGKVTMQKHPVFACAGHASLCNAPKVSHTLIQEVCIGAGTSSTAASERKRNWVIVPKAVSHRYNSVAPDGMDAYCTAWAYCIVRHC